MQSSYKLVLHVGAVIFLAGCTLSQVRSGGGGGGGRGGRGPVTRFTCQGRPTGYYADVDTGCQVYHMCDGGRQFSYTCPNTTLFQQRMLICDHWYMVNCSRSESEYAANLLIGQRDKPFVSEQEMHMRTPRPDILTVPYNNNYYDGLKQAESKYPAHPGNSLPIDSGSSRGDHPLDSGKNQFTPSQPNHQGISNTIEDHVPSTSTFRPSFNQQYTSNVNDHNQQSTVNLQFTSSTPGNIETDSDEFELDIRMKNQKRPTTATFEFVRRFDPNAQPINRGTAMTTSEILDINRQLPINPDVTSEEAGARRKSINPHSNFNIFETGNGKQGATQITIRTANTKTSSDDSNTKISNVFIPQRELQPPNREYASIPSTTMGPPIYYEWKWAVPAFDLEPPKLANTTQNTTDSSLQASESGRPTFRNLTRSSAATPRSLEQPLPSSATTDTEYNPSSYYVPDYIFPLDEPHPGYQHAGAQTSFQVSLPEKGRSYGENPNCPQCHPAYAKPGTCEPCVVKR